MDLEEELTRLAPRLLRYCRGRLRDRALAEEACQDALTALVGRWRRHGRPDSPQAFAFAVARRRAGRLSWRMSWLAPLEGSKNGTASTARPDEILAGRERWKRALTALARLSRRDREALLLVAAGELTTEEAAGLLAISRSAVKMRLHRARRRLAKELEEPK